MREQIRKSIAALLTLAVIVTTSLIFHATQSFSKNFSKGNRSFEKQHYMMALPRFVSAANEKPDSKEVLKKLALTYDKLDKKEDVLITLQRLLSLADNDPEMLRWAADTHYALDNFAMAEQAYRRSLFAKDNPAVKIKLAEVLAWQKKYSQSVVILEQLYDLNPKDYKTAELLADVQSWNKNYDVAIKFYSELLSSTKNKDLMVKIADCLRYSNRNEKAIWWYEKYLNEIK